MLYIVIFNFFLDFTCYVIIKLIGYHELIDLTDFFSKKNLLINQI